MVAPNSGGVSRPAPTDQIQSIKTTVQRYSYSLDAGLEAAARFVAQFVAPCQCRLTSRRRSMNRKNGVSPRESEQAMRIRKPGGRRRSAHELQHDQQHVPTAHGQWAELPGAVVPARLFLGRRRVGRSVAGRRRAVRGGSGAGPLHGLPRAPVGGQQGVRRHRRAAAHDDAEPVDAGGDLAFDGLGGAGRPRGSAIPARPAVARELHRLPGPGEPGAALQAHVEPARRRLLPELPRAPRTAAAAGLEGVGASVAQSLCLVPGSNRETLRQ